MGLGWQEIDKTFDLCYIRVAGLHRECKPAVLFDPPNFRPRTMTHMCMYVCMYVRASTVLCVRYIQDTLYVRPRSREYTRLR